MALAGRCAGSSAQFSTRHGSSRRAAGNRAHQGTAVRRPPWLAGKLRDATATRAGAMSSAATQQQSHGTGTTLRWQFRAVLHVRAARMVVAQGRRGAHQATQFLDRQAARRRRDARRRDEQALPNLANARRSAGCAVLRVRAAAARARCTPRAASCAQPKLPACKPCSQAARSHSRACQLLASCAMWQILIGVSRCAPLRSCSWRSRARVRGARARSQLARGDSARKAPLALRPQRTPLAHDIDRLI